MRNAADDALTASADSCERTALWGGIAVLTGLILEVILAIRHAPPDSVEGTWGAVIADSLVALGVGAEVLFSRMGARRQQELQRRANEKLGEANSELARVKAQLAPRSMTPTQQQAVAEKLKGFKGHRAYIAVCPDLPEGQMFARVKRSLYVNYGIAFIAMSRCQSGISWES